MFLLKSPAKINWSLYVLNKREDGYHNILSLMQCINLFDELWFESSDKVLVTSNTDILQEENLVYRSAVKLQRILGIKKGVKIHLKKNIPIKAGLGGGSSNAAFTLKGLKILWQLNISDENLIKIGAEIGSDVPFFFSCPMAIVEGKGEVVKPLEIKRSQILLLIKPPISVSSAWAYKKINIKKDDDLEFKKRLYKKNMQLIYSSLNNNQLIEHSESLHNDFEPIVFKKYPIIADLKNRLIKSGALAALMSGSGSTIFGVFSDKNKALNASRNFSEYWCAVVETITNKKD